MAFVLYITAALAWALLLYNNPVTSFMAACAACALHPLFVRIQTKLPGQRGVACYALVFICMIIIPISVLILLVIPQAAAGYHMLQRLRDTNFQMPDAWTQYWFDLKVKLSVIPGFSSMLNDFAQNFDNIMSKGVTAAVSGGVGLLGSTFAALWVLFLFITLTILCTVYAKRLYTLTAAITRMPFPMLDRFLLVIRGALRGVMLGVVLVALAQGLLCGVAFAVAGVNQPAFWGMLATLVAPIPLVGTAIVWLPLCIMLWFTGATMQAMGLFIWGVVAVAGIDNFLRPLFLQQGINAPIFVLVLAILCGLVTFGPVGLIAGPVLVAFAIQALEEADALRVQQQQD